MARSRNTQKKYRAKKFWDEFHAKNLYGRGISTKIAPHEMMFDFDKNPNWWDHLHTIERNRRIERDVLRAMEKGDLEAATKLGPYKKPKVWYW